MVEFLTMFLLVTPCRHLRKAILSTDAPEISMVRL